MLKFQVLRMQIGSFVMNNFFVLLYKFIKVAVLSYQGPTAISYSREGGYSQNKAWHLTQNYLFIKSLNAKKMR